MVIGEGIQQPQHALPTGTDRAAAGQRRKEVRRPHADLFEMRRPELGSYPRQYQPDQQQVCDPPDADPRGGTGPPKNVGKKAERGGKPNHGAAIAHRFF